MKYKPDLRLRFLLFLRWIARVPEATVPPKWLTVVYWILYPLRASYEKQSHIRYDFLRDTYHIKGIEFAGEMFHHLKKSVGEKFEIVESKDGIVTIKTIR